MPLHGKNQFPDKQIPAMRPTVIDYIGQVTDLGLSICDAISLALNLPRNTMRDMYLTPEPVSLMRCFKYSLNPSTGGDNGPTDGIGEHTDFGLLTFLKQDSPGLQVSILVKHFVSVIDLMTVRHTRPSIDGLMYQLSRTHLSVTVRWSLHFPFTLY